MDAGDAVDGQQYAALCCFGLQVTRTVDRGVCAENTNTSHV